jgi:hypothetical protein
MALCLASANLVVVLVSPLEHENVTEMLELLQTRPEGLRYLQVNAPIFSTHVANRIDFVARSLCSPACGRQ